MTVTLRVAHIPSKIETETFHITLKSSIKKEKKQVASEAFTGVWFTETEQPSIHH